MTISTRLQIAATIVLLTSQSAFAGASENDATASVTVSVSDLNLTTMAGKAALHQRLTSATREVCGDPTDLRRAGSIKQLRANKACFDRTFANAMDKLDAPLNTQASAY